MCSAIIQVTTISSRPNFLERYGVPWPAQHHKRVEFFILQAGWLGVHAHCLLVHAPRHLLGPHPQLEGVSQGEGGGAGEHLQLDKDDAEVGMEGDGVFGEVAEGVGEVAGGEQAEDQPVVEQLSLHPDGQGYLVMSADCVGKQQGQVLATQLLDKVVVGSIARYARAG